LEFLHRPPSGKLMLVTGAMLSLALICVFSIRGRPPERFAAFIGAAIVVALAFGWLFMATRTYSVVLLIAACWLHASYLRGRKVNAAVVLTWGLFVVSTFVPFDVSLQRVPGPARLVPLYNAGFSGQFEQQVLRGECAWNGFVGDVEGGLHQPNWILVW